MWKKRPTLEEIQSACASTLVANLGIEFTALGENYIEARMPVDERTMQPMGVLHGGAAASLAGTLVWAGSYLSVEEGSICVGLEINANYIRPVTQGWVVGRATPLHIGKTTQVWQILIRDTAERLICVSRLTIAVRPASIPIHPADSSSAGAAAARQQARPGPFTVAEKPAEKQQT